MTYSDLYEDKQWFLRNEVLKSIYRDFMLFLFL
jgi:hypothetical protein